MTTDKELRAQFHLKNVRVETSSRHHYTGTIHVYTDDGSFFGNTTIEIVDYMGSKITVASHIVDSILSGSVKITVL